MLFRLQPRFARRRFPQLASQALGFGAGLGILQRDHRLSGADDVAVRDQDLPDDAALKMLNRLAARFGFDGAGSNRSTFERRIGRPGPETDDEAANQQVSCPGDTAQPVAERQAAPISASAGPARSRRERMQFSDDPIPVGQSDGENA